MQIFNQSLAAVVVLLLDGGAVVLRVRDGGVAEAGELQQVSGIWQGLRTKQGVWGWAKSAMGGKFGAATPP